MVSRAKRRAALFEDFTAKNPNIAAEVEFLSYDDFINVFKQSCCRQCTGFRTADAVPGSETIDAGLILELDSDLYPAESARTSSNR